MSLKDRLDAVRTDIAGGSIGRDVVLVAVTKGQPVSVAIEAYDVGLRVFGENYAQELLNKAPQLPGDVEWHFIGRVQRNKVRALAPRVALWQSVDRASLAAEIAKHAPGASVLVQPNLSTEPGKGGCDRNEVDSLVDECARLDLDVRGLMGVGVFDDPAATKRGFEWLVASADRLGLPIRSIGMTDDLGTALAAGSTMVRLGRSLFGDRPGPA